MQTNDHLPIEIYRADEKRYSDGFYRRCGKWGIKLPQLSLGLWHNFGNADNIHNGRKMLRRAFDLGITHFDLANNYGPPYGSAEENFGTIFKKDFKAYRKEIVLATKAGYDMWAGPYGRGGSKKYLVESCEESLSRMGVDYVDIFYHHCPDPETPLEETASALAQLVRQGKALYVGLSNYYEPQVLEEMITLLQEEKVPLLIQQLSYSALQRRAELIFPQASQHGFGIIAFSPLAQGLLTGKYNHGTPKNSRGSDSKSYLRQPTPEILEKLISLENLAQEAEVSMTDLALRWILNHPEVTSVLAGASCEEQIEANAKALKKGPLPDDLFSKVNHCLGGTIQ
jgi:L-glyceraldehyde 3-phosphate reductase